MSAHTKETQPNKRFRLISLVFGFFFIINILTAGAHTDIADGAVTFLITESMATKNSAKLHPDIPTVLQTKPEDRLHDLVLHDIALFKSGTGKFAEWARDSKPLEPVYSPRSLLLPAVAVPFYYATIAFSVSSPVVVVTLFVNSLIIALSSLVIFLFSLEIYGSTRIALVLALIFTVCSFVLPYNTTLFPQPLQALLLVTAVYFVYKSSRSVITIITPHQKSLTLEGTVSDQTNNAILQQNNITYTNDDNNNNNNNNRAIIFAELGAIFLGLSVFAQPTSIIFVPVILGYCFFSSIRHEKRTLSCFLMTLSILLLLMGLVNYTRFGSFTEFGYFQYAGLSFHKGGWTGLVGLLVSPGKGLIIYFPLVILLPLALRYVYNSQNNRWLFYLVIYVVVANWLFFGTIDDSETRFWSGATAWGPRYFVPILPFIVLTFGALIKRLPLHLKYGSLLKITLIVLCSAGFVINLPGKLVSSEYGEIYAREEEGVYLDDMAWNPSYSPVIVHIRTLMDNYPSHFPVEEYRYRILSDIAYGLAPCSYDFYIFCNFGLAPILVLSAALLLALAIITSNGKRDEFWKVRKLIKYFSK
jgi:hypothetical protein